MADFLTSKDRIIQAATELFHLHGLRGASIDHILERSGTGKGQFAYYFKNKEGLILAVLDTLQRAIKEGAVDSNYSLRTWKDFDGWFERYIRFQRSVGCELSCPLGTIGNDLSEDQELLRRTVIAFFEWGRGQLARFFAERKAAKELRPDADPDALADFCIAVMEGGMLMTKITRNTAIFERAAAQAKQYIHQLKPGARSR